VTGEPEFKPDWVSAPGDTITDILEERGLTVVEFAERLGMTLVDAEALLEGQTPITTAIAIQLEQVLGGSVEFWMEREAQYREDEKEE